MAGGGGDGRWRVAAAAVALFVATGAAYRPLTVPAGYNTTDPLLIVPSSLSLLRDGDLDLSEYGDAIDPRFHGVMFLDGRPYNRYPVGASLLVLPIAWIADRVLPPRGPPMERALEIAAIAAKVLAAASVALLFVLLAALTGRVGTALGLALVFGFATPHLPIHAGGLFTHNAVIPVLLIALLLLVWRDGRHAAAAGPVLAFAFVTRPTCAPVIALLSLYVARHLPEAWRRFALLGGGTGVAFVGWSLRTYAAPLPPYYWSYDATSPYVMSLGRFAEGLVGHLVSPSRGVFVFAPIVAFSVWGMVVAWRSSARHAALLRILAAAVVVHWIMISVLARKWWAGWSFGPRHVVEVFPLLIVLLVPALDAMRAAPRPLRAALASLGAVALAWSAFAAVHGARSPAPSAWSATPRSVDAHPERLWDWRDMQILRGVGR